LDFRNYPVTNADWHNLNPRIIEIRPAHDVGIENLYIGPIDTSSRNSNNIRFEFSANCWVSDIESYRPTFNHIDIGNSIYLTIEDSYFHHGRTDYSGGKAYGILLSATSTSCLVENNMFYWLRHAICFAGGANGNVAGYNSSVVTIFQDDYGYIGPQQGWPCADYLFHGHYPFANLVEGNVGQYFCIDDVWGSNGPYNMFYKNANIYNDNSFGLRVFPGNPLQNIIGNYITYKCNWIKQGYQGYIIESPDIYEYHNYDNGEYWGPGFWPWQYFNYSHKNDWYYQGNDNELGTSFYRTGTSDGWPEQVNWGFTARNDLKNYQDAYNNWKNQNYNTEENRYVTLKNIDENNSSGLSEGYFSVKRLGRDSYLDGIPSGHSVRLGKDENSIDIKVMQEKINTIKHHKWDEDRTLFLINSKNYVIGDDNEIQAKYYDVSQFSCTGTESVKVYLKDPWFVSDQENLTQPETYREINSGTNIPVFLNEGGSFPMDYPYYSVKASKCYATTDSIYVFSHWSSPNGKAVFDPANVNNYNGCGVRFDDAGAIVKPVYVAVNQIANYTLPIPPDETLTIPAGANISFADGFTFNVKGTLNIAGTESCPVTLSSTGKESGFASNGYGYLVTYTPEEKLAAYVRFFPCCKKIL